MKLYSCHSLMSTRLFANQFEETAETLEYIWGTFRGKKFLINTVLIVNLIGFRTQNLGKLLFNL